MKSTAIADSIHANDNHSNGTPMPTTVNLTCGENRVNMSPDKQFCRSKSRYSPLLYAETGPSVSVVFAETADDDLINRVLGMLLQGKYNEEGDGNR